MRMHDPCRTLNALYERDKDAIFSVHDGMRRIRFQGLCSEGALMAVKKNLKE